jgi:hypothetical protein
MNDMIAVIEKETMLCDFVEDSGRDIKYTFNPLITIKPPGDAFTLNPAAIPVIKDQANYYVNRVLIPVDIKRSELKKIMITMRSVYMGSKFGYNNRVTSASFQMPGYKLYCRLSEEHPNMYEIRYCAKGYPNED